MEKYEKSWSSKTESRRLSCLGYLFSLPSETSARGLLMNLKEMLKDHVEDLKKFGKV